MASATNFRTKPVPAFGFSWPHGRKVRLLILATAFALAFGIHFWRPETALLRGFAAIILLVATATLLRVLDRAVIEFNSQEPESGWKHGGGNVWTARRSLGPSLCFLSEALLLMGGACSLVLALVQVILGKVT